MATWSRSDQMRRRAVHPGRGKIQMCWRSCLISQFPRSTCSSEWGGEPVYHSMWFIKWATSNGSSRPARSASSKEYCVPCEYEMRGYGGNKLMKRLQVQARDVGICKNCKKRWGSSSQEKTRWCLCVTLTGRRSMLLLTVCTPSSWMSTPMASSSWGYDTITLVWTKYQKYQSLKTYRTCISVQWGHVGRHLRH